MKLCISQVGCSAVSLPGGGRASKRLQNKLGPAMCSHGRTAGPKASRIMRGFNFIIGSY